jgi:hypothetical protein
MLKTQPQVLYRRTEWQLNRAEKLHIVTSALSSLKYSRYTRNSARELGSQPKGLETLYSDAGFLLRKCRKRRDMLFI